MAENNTTYYQSRHTGAQIDDILDQSIAATAAANTSSAKAEAAAENANQEAAKIPGMVAGKADLDPATGDVVLSQLPPALAQIASYAYGIEFDTTEEQPACKRIGNLDLHRSLPIQSRLRGCLLDDDGEVVEYLAADDWTGATRDGSRGQVMCEFPDFYYRFEKDGTICRVWLSEQPLPGYRLFRRQYVSAYEAAIQRSTGKLCSVSNQSADYRGGDNHAAWDGSYRSLLGRPATNLSSTSFRNAARKRKLDSSEWNEYIYSQHKMLFWLFAVEYATFDVQAPVNPELTAEGFRQGGLGAGVTNMVGWSAFNTYMPFIPCGYTDNLGNGTGEVAYPVINEDGSTRCSVMVPRYRGVENPFGHIIKFVDGISVLISQIEGNDGDVLREVFVCDDPAKFADEGVENYVKVGNEASTNGYIKEVGFGEGGEIVPSVVGGSSSTYFCDYHSTAASPTKKLYAVLLGGGADYMASAGLMCWDSSSAPSEPSLLIGTRLSFVKRAEPLPSDLPDVLAASDCSLDARVATLERTLAAVLSGTAVIPKLQVKELGVWGPNNLILTGSGAPTKAPDRAGQLYIDTASEAVYKSTGNAAVADWKNL